MRKCPYCDFNSHTAGGELSEKAYIDALLADLEHDLSHAASPAGGGAAKPCIASIFIGGGTPSLFSPDAIHRLLEGVAGRLDFAENIEISLEANPGTVESQKFKGFRQAGVNRLSIGVQSFNDQHLQSLGRIHDGAQAVRAVELAVEAGFDNFNLDLMFGLPDQTLDEACQDIRTCLSLNPAHVSYYQLTLEPNTPFYKMPPVLPESDDIWEIQKACQLLLAENGFVQYEVSAYAREGRQCRHNLNYWRFGDYLGIGAGAHGKLTHDQGIRRYWKHQSPKVYMMHAGKTESLGGDEIIGKDQLGFEFLMNHLRLREGFSVGYFTQRTGLSLDSLEPGLSSCLKDGLLEKRQDLIRCTDKGWNFLDNVLERFL